MRPGSARRRGTRRRSIDAADADAPPLTEDDESPDAATTSPEDSSEPPEPQAPAREAPNTEQPKRQAGKQPGAPGFGRTQVLKAHETLIHRPSTGAACAEALPAEAPSVCDAGFPSVDLVWGDPA